jgi:homoserine O-succinyltransferase
VSQIDFLFPLEVSKMAVTLWSPDRVSGDLPLQRSGSSGLGTPNASQDKKLAIGLLNNMPDSALEATERQFISLLGAASDSFSIELSLLAMPGIPRGEVALRRIQERYVSTELLDELKLDGLIVTGREPLTPNLSDEPYWASFVQVLEYARENTFSTIWSCLAAHAAVLHMDGIKRVRSDEKHCGVFECTAIAEHPITKNVPKLYRLPHSRWNGLSEAELSRCGYEVLTRASSAGVDSFIRQSKQRSLFLFFQGHPEYEPDTLLLEYRRDVNRFLKGEASRYPNVPAGYFDESTLKELDEIRRDTSVRLPQETMVHLDRVLSRARAANGWHATAMTIYRNWLEYMAIQKKPAAVIQRPGRRMSNLPVAEPVRAAIR